MAKVYIKISSNNIVVDINSDIYLSSTNGYTKIDEGTTDKFTHAQTQYLSKGLTDEKGRFNYKYANNTLTELTEDEKNTLFVIPNDAVVTDGSDYGEVGTWADGNPSNEDRLYRFVTIVGSNREISIAKSDSQIVGTSNLMENVGFLGNYTSGAENDSSKVIVSLLGCSYVKTKDNTIVANDRVMSDDNGYAIKSSNNLGYRVLKVVSSGLLEIVVSPNTDMVQRIKTDVSDLQLLVANKHYGVDGQATIESGVSTLNDLIIYGKSVQDGTPTPENPIEIQNVVNPKVTVCGKNLLKPTLETTTLNGVTCTNNGDGTYTLNGTASARCIFKLASPFILKANTYKTIFGKNQYDMHLICSKRNYAEGDVFTVTEERTITLSEDITAYFYINIYSGKTVSNVLVKPMLTTYLNATYDDFEPYKGEQSATLPYTLNAIPVSSGGNVTIDGQQYISDYVDIERKELHKLVDSSQFDTSVSIVDKTEWLLSSEEVTTLTDEEVSQFKALKTYVPTSSIIASSDVLAPKVEFNLGLNGTVDNIINRIDDKANASDLATLQSNLNGLKFLALTQTEYDALETKDDNTIYFITE